MATLILNAGTSSAITVTCQRAGKSPPRLVGERSISFNGRDRNSIRGQAKIIPIVASYVDGATEALIQAAGYNGKQIPCSGDILGGLQAVCTVDDITSNIVPGTSPSLYEMSFTIREVNASVVLLKYAPGDTIAGESFSRSTTATYIDANGVVQTASINTKRDGHYVSGVRSVLLEGSGKNLCLQSENFGTTWTAIGTPTRSAAAHTASGVSLDLIGDDDAATVAERYQQTISFTGDGTKAVSICVRQGTSASSVIRLNDTTAVVPRLLASFGWVGGLPSIITLAVGTYLGYTPLADGVFRLLFSVPGVIAANVNSCDVMPATNTSFLVSSTGTLYAGGVQCEDKAFPTSYMKTTTATVTRGADLYSIPFTTPPQEMSVYTKFVHRGTEIGADLTALYLFGGVVPNAGVERSGADGLKSFVQNTAASGISGLIGTTAAFGDIEEVCQRIVSDGSSQATKTLNGGTESAAATSGTLTLPSAWSSQLFYPNGDNGYLNVGFVAFQSIKIVAGARTLAELRAA